MVHLFFFYIFLMPLSSEPMLRAWLTLGAGTTVLSSHGVSMLAVEMAELCHL